MEHDRIEESSEYVTTESSSNKELLLEVETDTWRNVTLYEQKEKYEPSGRYGHTGIESFCVFFMPDIFYLFIRIYLAFEVTNGGFSTMYVLGK